MNIINIIDEIKGLLDSGALLGGKPGSFFSEFTPYLIGTLIWFAIIYALLKLPLFKNLIKTAENEAIDENESNLFLLIPESKRIYVYYFFLIISLFAIICMFLEFFLFSSITIQSLVNGAVEFNNFKAFIIAGTITAFIGWVIRLNIKIINVNAKIIRELHNNSS